jgi:hypothetical protein
MSGTDRRTELRGETGGNLRFCQEIAKDIGVLLSKDKVGKK